MRASILATVIYSIFCVFLVAQNQAQPSKYDVAYADWERTPSVASFRKLQDAWRTASQFERDHAAYYFALAAVTTAAQAPKDDAVLLLREVSKVASEYPIVISRGKSARRFQDVASVHAKVWGAANADPFEGVSVGYEMTQNGDGFVALQDSAEIEPTIALGAEAVLEENERLGMLLSLDSTGSVVEVLPVAIADGTGSLRSRLKTILKHEPAGPNGPARFVKQEPAVFFLEHPNTTTAPTLAPPSSTPQQSTRQVKATEAKPTTPTPSEEQTSSTPWSIIVVLIVAATGLLWLLVKKRK